MAEFTLTKTTALKLLSDTLVAGESAWDGVLDGAQIALYQNDVSPSPELTWANLEEADFEGYVATAVVWEPTYQHPIAGVATKNGGRIDFHADDPLVTPQTIYGYYLKSGAGILAQVVRFDEPVAISDPEDLVSVFPELRVELKWSQEQF